MLVFAPWTVDTIYDIFITDYSVRAHPVQDRGLPANAIYRYAKFALVHWDVDCLEWLVLGAVERIEKEIFVCQAKVDRGSLADSTSPPIRISHILPFGSTTPHSCCIY